MTDLEKRTQLGNKKVANWYANIMNEYLAWAETYLARIK